MLQVFFEILTLIQTSYQWVNFQKHGTHSGNMTSLLSVVFYWTTSTAHDKRKYFHLFEFSILLFVNFIFLIYFIFSLASYTLPILVFTVKQLPTHTHTRHTAQLINLTGEQIWFHSFQSWPAELLDSCRLCSIGQFTHIHSIDQDLNATDAPQPAVQHVVAVSVWIFFVSALCCLSL